MNFNIFVFNIITKPMEELTYEEACELVDKIAVDSGSMFDNKYGRDWGAASTYNIVQGGVSHIYLVLSEIEPVADTKNFIAETIKTVMSDNFKVLSSEVQHIRMVDSIEEGKQIVNDIVDVLFNQIKNVH